MAETESSPPQSPTTELPPTVWPPTDETRQVLRNGMVKALSSPSSEFSEYYHTLPHDEAVEVAKTVEAAAFDATVAEYEVAAAAYDAAIAAYANAYTGFDAADTAEDGALDAADTAEASDTAAEAATLDVTVRRDIDDSFFNVYSNEVTKIMLDSLKSRLKEGKVDPRLD